MKIPEDKIDEIRMRADIVEVVAEDVDLKRVGSNFVGYSPFNKSEKNPSFVVSPDKQIFKCFSTGKAGNAFKFLMEYHGMTFVESVKNLAEKYGINISEFETKDPKADRKSAAYDVLEYAANKYSELLFSKEGRSTYNYFQKRGFSRELIEKFSLGYSPDSWNYILENAKKAGFTEQNLLDAGLIIKKDSGKTYDRFRNRAMFTIKNFLGKPVGFGARILIDDDNQPKYINSPQTLVYDKSNILYGLHEGKNAIRNNNEAILVEGYADVLALAEHGFKNTVAASGTSLTQGQLKLLKRYAKTIYFMLDADSAGIAATEKGLMLALESNFEVKIVELPDYEDPDTMLKRNGRKSIEFALRDAVDFIDFKFNVYKKAGKLDSPSSSAESLRELIQIISKIPDKLQHDFYISRIASRMGLSQSQLKQIYTEKNKNESKPDYKSEPKRVPKDDEKITIRKTSDILNQVFPEELFLLKFILSDEKNLYLLLENYEIGRSDFISKMGRILFDEILKYSDKSNLLDALVSDPEANQLFVQVFTDIAFNDEKPSENWSKYLGEFELETDNTDKMINDTIMRLQIRKIATEINQLKKAINENDDIELLVKIKNLNERKKDLTEQLTGKA